MNQQDKILKQVAALTAAQNALASIPDVDVDAIEEISAMVQDLNSQLAVLGNPVDLPGISQADQAALQQAVDALSVAVQNADDANTILAAAVALKGA